jgi:hypothetical protein
MNARNCPKCQRELPVEVLRVLEQGVSCPFCATRLKRTPRRAPTVQGHADGEYAALEVSHTPPVTAHPTGEDSYRWFQTKGSPAAPPAVAERAHSRSPLKPPPVSGMPGLTPPIRETAGSTSAPPANVPAARTAAPARAPTEVAKRPPSLAATPPAPLPEPRRAPTIVGTAPPLAEKPSPPAPVQSPSVPATSSAPAPAALAMTAVLPSGASTLALAGPALVLPLRSRRNVGIAVGMAAVTLVIALLLHRPPAERPAPLPSVAPEALKPPVAIQPLRAEPDIAPARPAEAAPIVDHPSAETERGAVDTAIPKAHQKVRIAHHATARQRRTAKHDKQAKRARHERGHARRQEVASRGMPVSGDEGDARASYQRGNTLLFAGDAAGAVAAYRKAVELAPADPIGYRGLGLAYEQQGGTAAAIRALRKYLKLAPGAADREIIARRIARLSQSASHP